MPWHELSGACDFGFRLKIILHVPTPRLRPTDFLALGSVPSNNLTHMIV